MRLRNATTPAAANSTASMMNAHSESVGTGSATSVTSAVALFVTSQSPPPATTAVFVTEGTALALGVTVSVMLPGIDAVVVQVTTWPTAAHVQLTPVADTNVNPAGSVSVTVIAPLLVTPLLNSPIE